jgi:hypothetical protein
VFLKECQPLVGQHVGMNVDDKAHRGLEYHLAHVVRAR